MKRILFIATLIIAGVSYGQKVKISDDIASVDDQPYVKFTTITFGSDYSIKSVSSDVEEISILYLDYNDPQQVSKGNPEGKVRWIEVSFLTLGLKCEVESRTRKGFVKMLYLSNIYVDGKLHVDNAKAFVSKYGTKFSDNRPQTGNTTIIINN